MCNTCHVLVRSDFDLNSAQRPASPRRLLPGGPAVTPGLAEQRGLLCSDGTKCNKVTYVYGPKRMSVPVSQYCLFQCKSCVILEVETEDRSLFKIWVKV